VTSCRRQGEEGHRHGVDESPNHVDQPERRVGDEDQNDADQRLDCEHWCFYDDEQ